MKLLLDTHIWAWSVLCQEKIRRQVRRHLDNPKNELYFSPISIWEAHLLERRGKLRLKPSFSEWLDQALQRVPLHEAEAPLNFAVAAEACRIPLRRPDLGDLFLAATASEFDLTLVTDDSQFIQCDWLRVLPND